MQKVIGTLIAELPAENGRAEPAPPAEAGRAIYLRERCDACHTQIVRPFLWEVENRKLKQLLAEAHLDNAAMKELLRKNW